MENLIHDISLKNTQKLREELQREISKLSGEQGDMRQKRIELEDILLKFSPQQRKNDILDYIRRGRLSDSLTLMPELILATPKFLESGLIDFEENSYNQESTKKKLVDAYKGIEQKVIKEDHAIRDGLSRYGVHITDDTMYADLRWENDLRKKLGHYRAQYEKPMNPKSPLSREEHLRRLNMDTVDSLQKIGLSGNIKDFLTASLHGDLLPIIPAYDQSHIEKFLIDQAISAGGFLKYPKLEEYNGKLVEEPPSFRNVHVKKGIKVIPRDTVPDFRGGIIFDGNFGYDKEGKLIQPQDRMIVDHHDALDEKRYDTATHMAQRIWNGSRSLSDLKRKRVLWKKYESEPGKVYTLMNAPDTDALLAIWSFRNPMKAKERRVMLDKISYCGDFLIGSTVFEKGATARDYNYIFMEYLRACQDKIRKERTEDMEAALVKEKEQFDRLKTERGDLMKGFSQEDFRDKSKWPLAITQSGGIDEQMQKIKGDISSREKIIQEEKNRKLSTEDQEKIVSHLLQKIEDILDQPFKYKKFLEEGRRKEQESFSRAEKFYREGEIDIAPYRKDQNILVITPGTKQRIPKFEESIDGLYFFLRKRIDFNRPIVVTADKDFYMIAINTQDHKLLEKYDFNQLIQALKNMEVQAIAHAQEKVKDEIAEFDRKLTQDGLSDKENKELEKLRNAKSSLMNQIEKDADRLREGRLWRSRTQMAFALRSYIPKSEIFSIVHEWKKKFDIESA